jgi:hypothetical protein
LSQVTEEIAPDYFKVISHPMDLSTIQSKLFKYRSIDDFDKHVQVMFENAQQYHPAHHEVHKVRECPCLLFTGVPALPFVTVCVRVALPHHIRLLNGISAAGGRSGESSTRSLPPHCRRRTPAPSQASPSSLRRSPTVR